VDLPDGTLIEYIHDPLGRRIAKKVDGEIVEKYLWDGLTRLLAVYDGNDALLMRFEYAVGRMPISMVSAGATYYLAYDQVGSLKAVFSSTKTLVKQVDYDTFGNVIGDTNPTFSVPFGFAGGLHDRDTGLVRFGFRDYDPDIGRWTAKDPIGFAGGDTDLYGYCLNDPVNWIDPNGLSYLVFDRNAGFIYLYPGTRENPIEGPPQGFPARNNVVSGANPWPCGTYKYSWHSPHPNDDANGSYGSNGNFIFTVPNRSGMGVHSGRANKGGPAHPTEGCIRTNDAGTKAIRDAHYGGDPLSELVVY
jgi:RHS repeat-associated protein